MKATLSYSLLQKDPDFDDVTTAVTSLVAFLREHGVHDPGFLDQFELLAAEALNNAVEHGRSPDGERFFQVRVEIRDERIELVVDDPSPAGDVKASAELPDNPLDESGRGFFLIRELSDSFAESEWNGGHRLTIHKRLLSPGNPYRPGGEAEVMEEMTAELLSSYEMINTLLGLGEWLASAPDIDAFMRGALERLCEVLGADIAYVRFDEGGTLSLLHSWGAGKTAPPPRIAGSGEGVEGSVYRSGEEFTASAPDQISPGDPLEGIFASGLITPVFFKERRSGVLVVGRRSNGEFFNAGQLKIARTVAEYLGITASLDELQRQRAEEERSLRDLEIAASIQLSLMPDHFGFVGEFDVYGVCRPALQAGGDYFDVIRATDGSVYGVVADVMGKGLSAALLATMLRSNIRTILRASSPEPTVLLREVNRAMVEDLSNLNMFITLSCGRFEGKEGKLSIASAGHHCGFLQDRVGTIRSIDEAGVPLGVFPEAEYPAVELPFRVGDRFLFYTDGIAEAASGADVFFGEAGVESVLTATHGETAQASVDHLLEAVARHVEGAEASDDRTALVLSRLS